jgi:uncharacterized protein
LALIDTQPLVALIDTRDLQHRSVVQALLHEPGPLITTWAVMTEALYFLGKAAESRGVAPWSGQEPLARRVRVGGLLVADLNDAIALRSLELMDTYADSPMDFADATLVALGEHRRDLRVVTFDTDFWAYRTTAGAPLIVLGARARP